LPEAARAFASSLAPEARGRFSLQVLVACAPENVQKAVSAVPADELFILPVNVKGRSCYRLCWGVYDGRPAAEAALGGLPSYFRQGGATPRPSPLVDLLP
jgi:septal ring-binding cell division protein DamX